MAKHKLNPLTRWDSRTEPMTADELLDALTAALAPLRCGLDRRQHPRGLAPVRRGCLMPRRVRYLGESCAL